MKHDWRKTNLDIIVNGWGVYNTYECSRCGITGKKHGSRPEIKRDYKFQSVGKYKNCDTSVKL